MVVQFLIQKYKVISVIILVLLGLHLMLGKPRWQHYPIYLVGVMYFIMVLLTKFGLISIEGLLPKLIVGIGVALILISIIFLTVFPMKKVPEPSGEYSIGSKIYDLEDPLRDEYYTVEEGDKRRLKYGIWYPAEMTKDYKKAKWISDGTILTRKLASVMHLPSFMLDHTGMIYSNSHLDAPISKDRDKYPVVIISHGWKGFRELHTDYAEELASNGFIAISIDHTYGSQAVKFKDGEVAYLNEEALPNFVSSSQYNKNSNILVTTYGEDVKSILDDLEKMNKDEPDFKGKLDLNKIGVLGHSTGGGGHVYISQKDKRIKAILGFDAWVNPIGSENFKKGLEIPTLFVRSQQWGTGPNNVALNGIIENSNNATLIQMDKTNHVDFSMSYMYSPLSRYIGFTGKLKGMQSSHIQRNIILHFFNNYLKDIFGEESYLQHILDEYPVVKLVKSSR